MRRGVTLLVGRAKRGWEQRLTANLEHIGAAWGAQGSSGRHRDAQGSPGRAKEGQGGPGRHNEAQGGLEGPGTGRPRKDQEGLCEA